MNSAWKSFFLQWIIPVGLFLILIISLYSGFTGGINDDTAENYEGIVTEATENYAGKLSDSIQTTEILGQVAADAISTAGGSVSDSEITTILNSVASKTNSYLTLITDSDGNALSNSGSNLHLNEFSYFESVFGDDLKNYHYVESDEIRGSAALIISVPVVYTDKTEKLLIYYPFGGYELKKYITADKDYDSQANIIIIDSDGKIVSSVSADDRFMVGTDVWDLFEDDPTALRRYRSKVQARGAGKFSSVSSGNEYLVCYSPIEGTTECLMVAYNKTALEKSEASMSESLKSKLTWFLIITILFIVVITIINIVQIYVSTRTTEDMQDKVDSDQLTGLRNKVATERDIKNYIENHPDDMGMLFLIDIDNFKKINDTMGHAFGDEVLRELGRNIGINFRVSDIIGRIGGDEFMIFLKNLKEDQNTIREAQKLTYFFKHFQVGDYVKYSVTASIGAAVYPAHGTDFESLYKAADQAVYKSKKRGKNRLSFYDDRDMTPEEVAYADAHLIDIERKESATPIEN